MIHPIAGKCKHCKADLSTYRSTRPAAAAPLPALQANGHPNGYAPNGANGHAPQPQVSLQALAAAQDQAQPILPPRPTGRMYASEPKPSAWKNWPVVVIVLAMIAIGTAVVLMVWPSHKDQGGKHALQPPPAPERMDTNQLQETNPTAPQRGGGNAQPQVQPMDPWSQPHSQIDPPVPTPAPQAPDEPDIDDLKDPFASPTMPTMHNGTGMATIAMVAHLCKKLNQCGTNDVTMKGLCDSFAHSAAPSPANCPAADRCIEHIDTMSCGDPTDNNSLDPMSVMTQFHDCAEAIKC